MVADLSIEIRNRVPRKEGRAKHTRIKINKKHLDFPRKASHLSKTDSSEVSLVKTEFGTPLVTEFALKITPKTLRTLVTSSKKHQQIKDSIRNMLSETGNKGINIIYPLLVNQRSPNEDKSDFRPFGKPTEKILEKLFDLLDIENLDVLILPVASSNGESIEWVKTSTKVFKNRKPDFLGEYILSGLVPRNVKETKAIEITKHYLKNDIKSLSFDFASRKVPEGRMRGIIDAIGKQWGDIYVHGTNVPHYDWHGTWRKSILPTYDLLVSTYGFDSFGNLRLGMSGDPPPQKKIKDKMERKRYRLIETYGTYDYKGLKRILDTHTLNCNCPVCKKTHPLDIYNRPNTINDLGTLSDDLKTHRLFSTHKEMNKVSKLIDKNKYFDHIKDKKDATNELSSILGNLNSL